MKLKSSQVFKLTNYMLTRAENELNTIFKTSVFLISLALVGFSQTMPATINTDYEAKKSLFEIMVQEEIKFNEIDCNNVHKINKSKCLFAQYQIDSNITGLKLALYIIIFPAFYFGIFLFFLSGYIFISSEYDKLKSYLKSK